MLGVYNEGIEESLSKDGEKIEKVIYLLIHIFTYLLLLFLFSVMYITLFEEKFLHAHFFFLQTISINSLLYESYVKYGSLTTGCIERLRSKHRLHTVQSLEDGLGRNVIRSVSSDSYFIHDELQVC